MTPEQWQRVEELYHAALELPMGERKDFLVRASSGDEVLHRKVEALLKSHDEGGGFLDKDALEVAARAVAMGAGIRAGFLLGATVSHYKTLSLCGAGGMGEVYLAEDVRLDRRVALKILRPEVQADEERMRRFMREAKAASALNHPNIATVYDVGESDGVHFIAMEYVDGQTLAEKIDGGPIDGALLIEIGRQVADALDTAHHKGITHRDVKSANLMLTPRGEVKVLDFGLAKMTRPHEQQNVNAVSNKSATMPGIVMGTVDYMSPEQILGKDVDHRTDIFSLGIVLYEMATGRLPFQGSTTGERLGRTLHVDPEPILQWNPNAPRELERIVRKCLAKDRDDRYQSARELRVDLTNLSWQNPALHAVSQRVDPHIDSRNQGGWLEGFHTRSTRLLVLLFVALIVGLAFWWLAWRNMPAQPEQRRISRISTFPGTHRDASFSPDGNRIAFINDDDGVPQVWVKTLAGGDPVQATRGPQPASRPRWSPKGDHILYALLSAPNMPQGYPSGDLWLVSPEGGDPQRLITGGVNPNWSRDGERLVFERGADLWIANADGNGQRRIENLPPLDLMLAQRRPALSPDGSLIAFFQNEPGVPWGDIWVIPTERGVARRLTLDPSWGGGLTWTPDGRFIVFSSERGGSLTLWKVPVAAGKLEPVLSSAGEDTDPEISRDGRKLIYTNTRTTRSVIITDPATGKSEEIYSSPTRKAAAFFSPRGDMVAFTETTETGLQLFTMRSDGTNRTLITRGAETRNGIPHWSRDGATLYYYQISPTPSFRKIPAQGGQSVDALLQKDSGSGRPKRRDWSGMDMGYS
jgi:serine/threonine protein kinase/Tol biopolymer transport system component